MSKMPNNDYATGYRKPPDATKYRKGKSGNPTGRPKGSKNTSALFDEALDTKVTVTVGGRRVRLSKRAVMVQQLVAKAMQGDLKALQMIMLLDRNAGESAAAETVASEIDLDLVRRFGADLLASLNLPKAE